MGQNFEIPSSVLDEIQKNIEDIILNFDIPEGNKLDVIKKINYMYAQTRHLSVTDGLTGLYNRRHFSDNFEREFLRATRYHNDMSLAIIDIDNFKIINDKFGHDYGDYVLKEIAYLISQTFRKTDLIFRYGGDEFAAIITETSAKNAFIPLERFRKAVEQYNLTHNSVSTKITVSIGVADINENIHTTEKLFKCADEALYNSKNSGRNSTSLYSVNE